MFRVSPKDNPNISVRYLLTMMSRESQLVMLMAFAADGEFTPQLTKTLRQIAASYTSTAAPGVARDVDDGINGTTYFNNNAHFTLTVPADWELAPPDVRDKIAPGALSFIGEPKKGVVLLIFRREV